MLNRAVSGTQGSRIFGAKFNQLDAQSETRRVGLAIRLSNQFSRKRQHRGEQQRDPTPLTTRTATIPIVTWRNPIIGRLLAGGPSH